MNIIKSPAEMTTWSNRQAASGKTIALVPTMGCFHEGHLSLMREAARRADLVVTSLFVNPMQFGANEDLSVYPQPFLEDKNAAENAGVTVLFTPDKESCYPAGFQTTVSVAELTSGLCGASRPGHFDGVTTVVAKLFNIVKPHYAVFGEKDFQQLAVIKSMVRDLNWDIEIISHPIVREKDGLAMSSRNRYLSAPERQSALCLSKALKTARECTEKGVRNNKEIISQVKGMLASDSMVTVDYIAIVNDTSLQNESDTGENSVLAMAVKIGKTRLIDNGYILQGLS